MPLHKFMDANGYMKELPRLVSGLSPSTCTDGDYLLANGRQFCGDTLNGGMLIGELLTFACAYNCCNGAIVSN